MCSIDEKGLLDLCWIYCGLLDQQLPTKSYTVRTWEPCDNGHAKPNAKESRLYGYHGTLAAKRKVSWLCVCVFYVGHPTMSNGPLLCAASFAELLPAVTLTHTQTNAYTQRGRFWGVPHPNTLHNTPPLHLLLLFSKLKVDQWSASLPLLSISQSFNLSPFLFLWFFALSSTSFFSLPYSYYFLISPHTKDRGPFFTILVCIKVSFFSFLVDGILRVSWWPILCLLSGLALCRPSHRWASAPHTITRVMHTPLQIQVL